MQPIELRCEGRRIAIVLEEDLIEHYCNSRLCGAVPGVAVLHRHRISTGELISTVRYKVPPRSKKGATQHGTERDQPAVRSA